MAQLREGAERPYVGLGAAALGKARLHAGARLRGDFGEVHGKRIGGSRPCFDADLLDVLFFGCVLYGIRDGRRRLVRLDLRHGFAGGDFGLGNGL